MANQEKARELLSSYRPDYVFGLQCLSSIGECVRSYGEDTLIIASSRYMESIGKTVLESLAQSGVALKGGKVQQGARPNAPREDVYRLALTIRSLSPSSILVIGGGSSIDAVKAANVLAALSDVVSPEIDTYFGTGKVSSFLSETGRKLLPLIAVETSSSSGSHLTKYSNITDPMVGQKKLIVDPAIVPVSSYFDYSATVSMGPSVTRDGALDAIAHTFEVFCGAKKENYAHLEQIAVTAISLVLEYAGRAIRNPEDLEARDALGLATDLGGVAIMVGGTSGGHLTSFSLVDCSAHGTACGLMNPYYAVFYSKAIQPQLKTLAKVFHQYGFLSDEALPLEGRALAEAVSKAMTAFNGSIGAPETLKDLPLFEKDVHMERILSAAKDPDLKMKLQNMPVPLVSEQVDEFMAPILEAAYTGDLSLIKELC